MSSQILIIKASNDICRSEIEHIKTIADMFSMSPVVVTLTDLDQFQAEITGKGPFQYIYLCTHANPTSFGEADGSKFFFWEDLAISLCAANCLGDDAILMLACCRGGLKMVAYNLFNNCQNIDYICGPAGL